MAGMSRPKMAWNGCLRRPPEKPQPESDQMNKTAVKKRPVTPASFKSLKDIDIPAAAKPAFNDLVLTTRDGAVQWLEANIRKARDSGPFVVDEILTAALARELLDRNPENRPIVATIVKEMASAIAAGEGEHGFYGMNGETIKISGCGVLNDGPDPRPP